MFRSGCIGDIAVAAAASWVLNKTYLEAMQVVAN